MTRTVLLILALCAVSGIAASAGNADAELRRAAHLHFGGETAQAVAIWRDWAAQGNVDAAYNLAVIHQYGDGIAKDSAEAFRWYRLAAEAGDHTSQFQLGLMYLNGEGVLADAEQAHRWFVANRQHHWHHAQSPQMQEWRRQAATLIWQRDMRESMAASTDGGAILADLRRRAGLAVPVAATPGTAHTVALSD